MPRMSVLNRARATAFLDEGVSVKEVARRMGVCPKAIRKLRNKFQATGLVKDLRRPGRPRVTTVRQDMSMVNKAETRRKLTGKFIVCVTFIQQEQHKLLLEHIRNPYLQTTVVIFKTCVFL